MLLGRFKVKGRSMLPTISSGTTVLISSLPYFFTSPKINDIVLVEDPRTKRPLLKRITNVSPSEYFVTGDNMEQSTDSRHFGAVARQHILGKVIFSLG